ncbi:holin class IV [Rhodococcus phage Mbo2]|uniref:Holin class IV n=1 Tax=Rhodococcus phage Mbo2 TaxID=2936911 RepID=A0A9E7L9W7_9CAUD|nr:holin class IV [Rhodococcus phage Mbo2]
MNILNIRTWPDARAFIHVLAPVLATALVASGAVDENLATQIVTLVLAVFSPALAMVNSLDGFRTWFYGVLGALNVILVALDVFTQAGIDTWMPVVTLLLGSAVAAANTNTTPSGDYVTVPASDIIARVRAEDTSAGRIDGPDAELPHVPPTEKE